MNARRWLVLCVWVTVVHNVLRAGAAILGSTGRWPFNYLGSYPRRSPDTVSTIELSALALVLVLAFFAGAYFWRKPGAPSPILSSALWAVLSGAFLGLLGAAVLTQADRSYGYILFIVLPFAMGFHAAVALSWQRPISIGDAVAAALASVLIGGVLLLATAIEGALCLVMAAPIAVPLAVLGAIVGYGFRRQPALQSPTMLVLLVGLLPSAAPLERALAPAPATLVVTTSIDIAASPERVWQTVLQPAKLRPPSDPFFRAGIAYPLASHIEGSGPAAIRYCDFSTGKLVEPVLLWEEQQRLRFTVTSNPLPMQEWTPYAQIHPPHLDGFLVSRQGEFRLQLLPGGGTRLYATTWYQHHLAPSRYWQLWSDSIIHRVHQIVLANIRERALASVR
jgi:hypothetical protein